MPPAKKAAPNTTQSADEVTKATVPPTPAPEPKPTKTPEQLRAEAVAKNTELLNTLVQLKVAKQQPGADKVALDGKMRTTRRNLRRIWKTYPDLKPAKPVPAPKPAAEDGEVKGAPITSAPVDSDDDDDEDDEE